MSNFWRSLDLPLINCEPELDFSWSEHCGISERTPRPSDTYANPAANPPTYCVTPIQTTGSTFQITGAKLCVWLSVNTLWLYTILSNC